MNAQQLEFDLFSDQTIECRLDMVHRQINEVSDSCGKVRRKLFAELGYLKKICKLLMQDNLSLKKALNEMGGQVGEWSYFQDDELFSYVTKMLD
jgi:hypothetical protein